MGDIDNKDIYSTPASGKHIASSNAQRRQYPFVIVFLLALAATVILSEVYWLAVDIITRLAVSSPGDNSSSLQYVYSLTSYKVLTAIPAALPDIYSGYIVAKRCKKYPYYCVASVYIVVLYYLERWDQMALSWDFAAIITIDLLYAAAACGSLWYYRRKYQKAQTQKNPPTV